MAESFLTDYNEMSRYFYLQSYQLKDKNQLIFLELPPVQEYYPNPDRVILCNQTKEKLSEQKEKRRVSFSIEVPSVENPVFRMIGYNEDIFKKYGNVSKSNQPTINWNSFEGKVEEEVEGEGEEDLKKVVKKKSKKEYEEIQKTYENQVEIDRAAVMVQKMVQRWKAKKIYKKMKGRHFKRMNAVKEFWKTEVDYVNSLLVLKEVYSVPLKKLSQARKNPMISPKDYRQIFQGLEAITGFNHMLSGQLKNSIFDEKGDYNHYNLLSVRIQSISPFLKMYNEYCSRYEISIVVINDLKKTNKKFAQSLEKMDRDDRTNKLGLSNYLIKPIQRVPRYKLLLRDIIRATEPEHPDYQGLRKAMEQISETATVLNARMHEIDDSQKVLGIQQKFVKTDKFVLHRPHRRFVKEGKWYKKQEEFHVHLFNDYLVISREKVSRGNVSYTFHEAYSLKSIQLYYSDDLVVRRHVKVNNDIYNLKTKPERNEWLEIIKNTKKEWLELTGERPDIGGTSQISGGGASEKGPEMILVPKEEEFDLASDQCIMITKNWKEPTVMLKYVKKRTIFGGSSHYRKFLISPNEDRIMWGSPKKALALIKMSEIKEISLGQTTMTFKRNPKPSAVGLSLSLLYGEGKFDESNTWTGKSLDLICLNKRDYEIWTRALRFLIQDRAKSAYSRKINNLPKDIDFGKCLRLDKNEKFNLDSREDMGDLYTFGGGRNGSLGHGDDKDRKFPKIVRRSLLVDVERNVCGKNAGIALLSNGQCLSWGHNEGGRLAHGDFSASVKQPQIINALSDYTMIDAAIGDDFTLFLDINGTLLGCGSNVSGVLGPEIKEKINKPEIISQSGVQERYVKVSCSPKSAAVVDVRGRVFLWGNGEFGQLGHGDKKNQNTLVQVEAMKDHFVTDVAFGNWHCLLLTKSGEVFCSGDGSFGQLGCIPRERNKKIETILPVKIPKLKDIVSITAGQSHCGAMDKQGRAFMWGGGNYGQVGNAKYDKINYVPIEIKEFFMTKLVSLDSYRFLELSCGDNHTVALIEEKKGDNIKMKAKRHVLVWGSGMHGRLGLNRPKEKDTYRPTCNAFFNSKKMIRSVCAAGQMSTVIVAHEWIPDEEVTDCMNCRDTFSRIRRRRHHCRWCLGVFCGKCSKKKTTIMQLGFHKHVRVCDDCFKLLKRTQEGV